MPSNERKYLQSGQLEHYCLGLLSLDEARQVEQATSRFPVVRAEVDRLTQALEIMLSTNHQRPALKTA